MSEHNHPEHVAAGPDYDECPACIEYEHRALGEYSTAKIEHFKRAALLNDAINDAAAAIRRRFANDIVDRLKHAFDDLDDRTARDNGYIFPEFSSAHIAGPGWVTYVISHGHIAPDDVFAHLRDW